MTFILKLFGINQISTDILVLDLTFRAKLTIFLRPYFDPFYRGRPLANTPQSKKRARQNTKRREHNVSQRSSLRSSIKKLLKLITENDKDAASVAYRDATSKIDSATSKGLHHKNRAARLKSRLNSRLRAISA
jgi:small subunit ribosomal protein S20